MQQNPDVRGVRASTIRQIGRHLWLIDEEFRQNPRNHRLFLEICVAPVGVTHELRRMNVYGVLGRYIPGVRPRGRPHAVRPVPRLHRRRAHAVRPAQSAPSGLPQVRPRTARACRASCRRHPATAGARLPRRTVPRHRQGTRRRSLGTGLSRCRNLLPRTGPVALRRAPGVVAGAQSPGVLHAPRRKKTYQRPEGDQRVRAAWSATRRTSTTCTC